MILEPAPVHAWAVAYWVGPGEMTENGRRFVAWLKDQKPKEARVLARAIEKYDSNRYFESEPEKWLERWAKSRRSTRESARDR